MPARTPTVNRLRLGAVLSHHRKLLGLNQQQLGSMARVPGGQSSVSGFERGDRAPTESDLANLQEALGITDHQELCAAMARMQQYSSQRGRWSDERAVYETDTLRRVVDLEQDADEIKEVAVGLMPDLLMCENYIRAIMGCPTQPDNSHRADKALEARVAAKLARAELLTNDGNHCHYHFILGESALKQVPRADLAVMREQIAHVIELSKLEHITIQVVPFVLPSLEALEAIRNSFMLLHVPAEKVTESFLIEPFEYVRIGSAEQLQLYKDKGSLELYNRHFKAAEEAGLKDDAARLALHEASLHYRRG